jgi:hypothetical protein
MQKYAYILINRSFIPANYSLLNKTSIYVLPNYYTLPLLFHDKQGILV